MDIIKRLLVNKTDNLITQLLRYAIVGGLSFIVDYGLLVFLTEFFHLHYLLSATLSFIAGLTINYLISVKWIFRHSKLNNKTVEFTVYGVIGVIGLLLNNALMYYFTDYLHIYYMISKLISAVIVLGWNFVGRKYILFKDPNQK